MTAQTEAEIAEGRRQVERRNARIGTPAGVANTSANPSRDTIDTGVPAAGATVGAQVQSGGDIAKFMQRVVPWPQTPEATGLINLHWTSPKDTDPKTGKIKGMHGRPFRDVKDLISFSQWLATNNHIAHDVYFCLSSQVSPGKKYGDKYAAMRHARNVLALKALWLDVDVKPDKGYPTTVAAVEALHKFIADAKLPPISALVLSGSGGMHVYWISDKPLSVEEWRPYAEGLEALRIKHGFKADAGLTTDCVRILRVPGTFNFKNTPPSGVALKLLGADVNFEQALGHIRVTGPVTNPLVAAGAVAELPFDPALFPRRPPLPAGHESLADGIHIHDDTPLDWAGLVKAGGCPHFQDALRTGGKDYEQGLWMLDVLACTFLQDGRELARKVSKGYETYTASETDLMYERKANDRKQFGLGWPSCEKFEAYGCKLCATCQHKGKIRSPLNLAARAQPKEIRSAAPSFVDPYAEFAAPAFPLDVLPPTLHKFVRVEHQAMGADPSAIAMAALTAVAGAMHAETLVKVGESWSEKPILWTALVGQPSTMKSPIIDKVHAPLIDIDRERHTLWQGAFATWKQQNTKSNKMPQPPKPARCVVKDVTVEKTAEILSRDTAGSLMVHDELAGWFDGFDRYNGGQSSRAFSLSCWNGGHFTKDRVGKGKYDTDAEIVVQNLALCILGAASNPISSRACGVSRMTASCSASCLC